MIKNTKLVFKKSKSSSNSSLSTANSSASHKVRETPPESVEKSICFILKDVVWTRIDSIADLSGPLWFLLSMPDDSQQLYSLNFDEKGHVHKVSIPYSQPDCLEPLSASQVLCNGLNI